jgi:UDP-N-acetylglucosamine 2-epimerase (non-hydrolysing)
MKKFKLITVVGTRPEIIRLSRSINSFDNYFDHILVHTNQNYDKNLKDVFFKDLKIRKPNYTFEHKNLDIYQIISNNFIQIEKIIKKEKPDAFLVLGDTNSSLTSYVAKRNKVPIFHVEAGNRCFDYNVPEEINRKIVDHISDVNVVYSSFAKQNLINEGISNNNIIVLGSPLYEVIHYYKKKVSPQKILKKYKVTKNNFILVSFHREENLINKKNIEGFKKIINYLTETFKTKLLVSTHPRSKKYLNENIVKNQKNISYLNPFSFTEYLALQISSKLIISDSGSLPEESSILNLKSICLRENFERQEIFPSSSVIMCKPDIDSFKNVMKFENQSLIKDKSFLEYNTKNFSDRLSRIIISKIDYINKYIWHKN